MAVLTWGGLLVGPLGLEFGQNTVISCSTTTTVAVAYDRAQEFFF